MHHTVQHMMHHTLLVLASCLGLPSFLPCQIFGSLDTYGGHVYPVDMCTDVYRRVQRHFYGHVHGHKHLCMWPCKCVSVRTCAYACATLQNSIDVAGCVVCAYTSPHTCLPACACTDRLSPPSMLTANRCCAGVRASFCNFVSEIYVWACV